MRPPRDRRPEGRRSAARVLPTSLDLPLRRESAHWTLDATRLPLFHGLSVLARALGEAVLEQGGGGPPRGLEFERPLRASENPELRALGIEAVHVLAGREVAGVAAREVEGFQERLRAVFGALQIERWRRVLLPSGESARSRALVFAFPLGASPRRVDARFLLERVPCPSAPGRFLLRLTLESARGRRLDLSSVRHALVDDLGGRRFLAGSTRIAQTLRDLLQRAAERGRRSLIETRRPDSFLFQRLSKAGFDSLRTLSITCSDRLADDLVELEPQRLDGALKKVFLALEDPGIRGLLLGAEPLLVRDGDFRIYLDVSQHGRTLNLALDQPRHRPRVEDYLGRMPRLAGTVRRWRGQRPLSGIRVLLVHHITSEILATIAALRELGCEDLTVLFVRYAGEIPHDYVEALMELEPGTFSAHALHNLKDPEKAEGTFVLSKQFSPHGDLARLDAEFHARRPGYLEAMTRLAGALFARMLRRPGPCLLVEDGGYLAPVLAEVVARGATLGRFFAEFGSDEESLAGAEVPLSRVLDRRLLGTVEHTRNGHDRLAAAQDEHGALARPAFSIGISRVKVEEESEEVAASILNAVENVLHATGRVFRTRRALVLGSRGAIGSRLVRRLAGVLSVSRDAPILGIDLRAGEGPLAVDAPLVEARRWSELPAPLRRRVDVVIGVTGRSLLGAGEMEELLGEGTAPAVVFASGSTKTIEFHDAAVWAERALDRAPARGEASAEEIVDPQTGRVYGTRYTLPAGPGPAARAKRFEFLANLTPVNFLFYGVPTEGMDAVLETLVSTTLGLVRAVRSGAPLPPRLHAVDLDIDVEGRPLRGPDR